MAAADEAMSDSKLDLEVEDCNRIGVVFASGIGGIKTFEEEVSGYYLEKDKGPRFNPFFIPKMISDIAAGHIAIKYGFHGLIMLQCLLVRHPLCYRRAFT